MHPGWIQDAVTELQIEPITQSEQYIYMITSIREDIKDGLLRFAFIAYFAAISFARADTAVRPYAEDLDRTVQVTRVIASSGAGGPEAESVATRKTKTSVYR